MIGEMLGELTGKIIGQRIVSHYDGGHLKIERTMETKGRILGHEVTFLATFWSMERPQGGMFSKAMVRGAAISVPSMGPGWSMRGSRYIQTKSPLLKRLNEVAIVFETEITPDGMVHDKWWEWK
jgi:hypothetical protein